MSKTVCINIPSDPVVASLCGKLHAVRVGFSNLGLHARLIDEAIAKLEAQSAELTAYRALEKYQAGYKDGHDAAFATGLTTEE